MNKGYDPSNQPDHGRNSWQESVAAVC